MDTISRPIEMHTCEYCGLVFRGSGYSADSHVFCCIGCYLVQRIIGNQDGQGVAAWVLLRLGIGAFLSMNVMMLSLVLYSISPHELGRSTYLGLRWGILVLATPAMVILGGPFLASAIANLRRGRMGMDALILIGSLSAYGVSSYNVMSGFGNIYFDTATMLLVIVTVGRLLEASAKSRTSRAIRELAEMLPEKACLLRDGREVDVEYAKIRVGDVMVVRPGGRVPADGRIISGECSVEEAAFTGECFPRRCGPGSDVFGGSINCDGFITVEARAVGEDSLLSQIQRMVEEAQANRIPFERMASRVSAIFVPVVASVAACAAAYWGLMRHDWSHAGLSALSVMVVACPCALGLAAPLATSLAIGRAARCGVLIRSGDVLERLSVAITAFVDKTGTLTQNELHVKDIRTLDGVTKDEVLAWAASVESGSEHPAAKAIVNSAVEMGLKVGKLHGFSAVPGQGVVGTVSRDGASRLVAVGSPRLFSAAEGGPLSDSSGYVEQQKSVLPSSPDGEYLSEVYVGWDGVIHGVIFLEDRLRPDALKTVDALKQTLSSIIILSGCGESSIFRISHDLGLDKVYPECTPGGKAYIVQASREGSHGTVVMIGDGINDAPALAQADVGIAVGSGKDLARESSDVTLVGDDILRIPWVLSLSRLTCRTIRRNLWWAFGYNTIALCLAFMGLLHPLIAATAMFLSSLSVIGNSMRVLSFPNPESREVAQS